MKLLVGLILACSFTASANQIPQSLLDDVATDIDNICGDTWCEGDFDWAHDNLKCDLKQAKCTMDLTLIGSYYYDDEDHVTSSDIARFNSEMAKTPGFSVDSNEGEEVVHYDKVCVINNVNTISDIVNSGSYSDHLYDTVLDCVGEMEEAFYDLAYTTEITSRLNSCQGVEIKNIQASVATGNFTLGSRIYYNELDAWNDLNNYVLERAQINSPREISLDWLVKWDDKNKEQCKRGLTYLENNWHVLGVDTQRDWTKQNRTRAFIFSTPKSNSRVKVLLKTEN